VQETSCKKPGLHRLKFLVRTILPLILLAFTSLSRDSRGARDETLQIPAVLVQPASYPQSLAAVLGDLKKGVEYYSSERYALALQALPDDREVGETLLADYVLLYRAKSYLMMERSKEALSAFHLLQERYPGSPLIRDAIMGECQALLKLSDARSALTLLSSSKVEANSESLYYQAKSFEQAGEKGKALELYLQLYSRYPGNKFARLSEPSLLHLSPGALTGGRNYAARLLRAENLLKSGDARSARLLLITLGRFGAPDSRTSDRRLLLLAQAEQSLGRTSEALSKTQKVTAGDPDLHARAMSLQAACLRKLDRIQALLALRDKALKLYPQSPDTEEICYSVATYFDVNYDNAKARQAYQLLYDSFPRGQRAERTLWKLALFSYFEKKYSDAAAGFWKYLVQYSNPLSASSAMYWMGRCYEKLGDFGHAKYLYGRAEALGNNSYYGERARDAEAALVKSGDSSISTVPGIDFNEVVSVCDGIQLPAMSFPEPAGAAAQTVERARRLVAAELPALALSELRWGNRRYPEYSKAICFVMSRLYQERGDFNEAIACLYSAFPDYNGRPSASLPDEVWQLFFPVRNWGIISAQAVKTRTDPSLILGLIRQESGFEADARSRANARGLMQILPSTGRKLARRTVPRFNSKKLYQPETNIILGTKHLANLIQVYGKEELALAAYNAGETRVDRWLQEFGKSDMVEFVEQIPFSETRNYVKQVLSNKAHYSLIVSRQSSSAGRD
jgi:soluble lytic murein transglycosylase